GIVLASSPRPAKAGSVRRTRPADKIAARKLRRILSREEISIRLDEKVFTITPRSADSSAGYDPVFKTKNGKTKNASGRVFCRIAASLKRDARRRAKALPWRDFG